MYSARQDSADRTTVRVGKGTIYKLCPRTARSILALGYSWLVSLGKLIAIWWVGSIGVKRIGTAPYSPDATLLLGRSAWIKALYTKV